MFSNLLRKLFGRGEEWVEMADMKMIVGLGNPGPRYARNRHNIGFQIVDLLARRHDISLSRSKYNGLFGDGWISQRPAFDPENPFGGLPERQKVLLVRPLTFMNRSGDAVGPLAHYFEIEPEDIFVIYDELDLPSGKLRLRPSGGSGGHNGIKSLIRHLGTNEFPRARVGIGRPDGPMDPADYVLQNFSEDEEIVFETLRARVADAVECWLFQGIEAAMNRYNGE